MLHKKKHKNVNKNRSRLLALFISLSFLMWLTNQLAKSYTTVISVPLVFTGLAPNQLLSKTDMKSQVSVAVTASGYRLFWHQLIEKKMPVEVRSAYQIKNRYFLSQSQLLLQIQQHLPGNVNVNSIAQDTFFLPITRAYTKKVPLIYDHPISFSQGFRSKNELEIFPDSITIKGSATEIDTIHFLRLDPLNLEALDQSVEEIAMVRPQQLGLLASLSPPKIVLKLQVERFTEGIIEVPVEIINLPPDVEATLFPSAVKIKFVSGFEEIKTIKPNDFRVVADFMKLDVNGHLPLELFQSPVGVGQIEISDKHSKLLISKNIQ